VGLNIYEESNFTYRLLVYSLVYEVFYFLVSLLIIKFS
jgi:hypothetical protein